MPTPFSQTIVFDTFTRANSGNLGANWTANSDATTTGTMGIVSNAAQPSINGNAASFYSAAPFQADQYAQVVLNVSALGTNTHGGGPTVRGSAGGYYRLFCSGNNIANNCQIAKVVNGTFTSLGGTTQTMASGDLLRLEIVGNVLNAYRNGNLIIGPVTDSALATGAPGVCGFMAASSPTASLVKWEGGSLLWTRQGTVIPIGTGGGTQEPNVLYETGAQILTPNADGKIYKMWFTNGWSALTPNIFYAEANNAAGPWTQYVSNPVVSDGATGVAHGFVLHPPGSSTYYGFFANGTTATQFNRWTSSDGIIWTKTNSAVLTTTAAAWDSLNVYNPTILVSGNTWTMLYEGRSSINSSVGMATSTDLGVTWVKFVSNPVIPSSGTVSASMGKTSPVLNGNLYYLLAHGTLGGSNVPSDIDIRTSPDLITWTDNAKNPVYERARSNEGANLTAGQVADDCLIEQPAGTTNMFYSATDAQASGHIHVNLAIAPFSILQLMGMISGTNIIAGNVGVPGATVNYSGPVSGSVTADSLGNYVIPITTNGTYTVTPNGVFLPTSQNAVISSADVTGLNFTSPLSGNGFLMSSLNSLNALVRQL
jgi:hypothetical protein